MVIEKESFCVYFPFSKAVCRCTIKNVIGGCFMEKAKVRYLNDQFDVEGRWYLPGQNSGLAGVVGCLKYTPDRIVLNLQGSFTDFVPVDNDGISKRIVILGISNEGERFSLFDCLLSHASKSYPGYETCTYYVSRFYAGEYYLEDEAQLNGIEANFSFFNLDAWLRYHILTMTASDDRKQVNLSIDFETKNINKRTYNLQTVGLRLSEEIGYNIQLPKDYFEDETTKVSFRRHYHLSPDTDELASPKALLDVIQGYRRLLVLLVGAPMYLSYVEYSIPGNVIKEGNKEIRTSLITRLFFSQVGNIVDAKKLSPWNPRSILISRNDIEDNLENIITNWFEKEEMFNNCFAAFISDLYVPGFIETEFLNTAKGLESFHRFFVKDECKTVPEENDALLDKERKSIIKFITDNVSYDNIEYFVDRVNYKDEDSFRKRLQELIFGLPAKLRNKLFGELNKKGINKFIAQVVDTRNYFTHRDSISKYNNAVVDLGPLLEMHYQLSGILRYYCLKEVGVDPIIAETRLVNWLPY